MWKTLLRLDILLRVWSVVLWDEGSWVYVQLSCYLKNKTNTCFFCSHKLSTFRYGYLVRVVLPGNMRLNIHLKNVLLVKQKKRWSQNLAIEVILTQLADQPREKFEQVSCAPVVVVQENTCQNMYSCLREWAGRMLAHSQMDRACF